MSVSLESFPIASTSNHKIYGGATITEEDFSLLLVPLQTVEDTPLPDTREDKLYAPLFENDEYLENDPKCDNDKKLKVHNLWEFYFCECLKIDKVCTHTIYLHKTGYLLHKFCYLLHKLCLV